MQSPVALPPPPPVHADPRPHAAAPRPCTRSQLFYTFFDQYRIIDDELLTNFALCLVAVTLICTVTVVHPLLCGYVMVVMVMIDVDLVGMLWMWGLSRRATSCQPSA